MTDEAAAYWVRRLPPSPEPLSATSRLRDLLAGGATLYLDFDEPALTEARRSAQLLPTVADVRRGFVCLQRGAKLPFEASKQLLVRIILTELDLLDPHDRVRRGEKRDPHSSPTMMRSLIESYRLSTLLNAYRSFDDSGFEVAALTVLST